MHIQLPATSYTTQQIVRSIAEVPITSEEQEVLRFGDETFAADILYWHDCCVH